MNTKRTKWIIALLAVSSLAILGLTGCKDKSQERKQDLTQSYKTFLKDNKDNS